jgi:hypothetical protein
MRAVTDQIGQLKHRDGRLAGAGLFKLFGQPLQPDRPKGAGRGSA